MNGEWQTVRVPWSQFIGKGPGAAEQALDVTRLRRLGIVAIGQERKVHLSVSSVRFFKGAVEP